MRHVMQPHIRAVIAVSAHAAVVGRKVAGLYDHDAGQHRRLAAEARGGHLQGYDGDRDSRFGGSLPELRDVASGVSFWMKVAGTQAQGYDRSSACHFTAEVSERLVHLYDHNAAKWFAFDVQVA